MWVEISTGFGVQTETVLENHWFNNSGLVC